MNTPQTEISLTQISELSTETLRSQFNVWQKRATAIQAAFSKVKIPTTDEEDAKLEELIVKSRPFLESSDSERLDFSRKVKTLQDELMRPIKIMSESIELGKSYRNSYAKWKAEKQEKERAEIRAKEAKENEIIRVRLEIQTKVSNGISDQLSKAYSYVSSLESNATLDTYNQYLSVINKEPSLKEDIYLSWLDVPYSTQLLSKEEYLNAAESVVKELSFNSVSKQYTDAVKEKIKPFVDRSAELLKKLKSRAELAKKNKEEADKQQAEAKAKAEEAAKAEVLKMEEERTAKEAELKAKAEDDALLNNFSAQASVQTIEDQENIRKTSVGVIDCDEVFLLSTLVDMLKENIFHPKHKGIFEKEKSGELKRDEDGYLIPVKWVKDELTFYVQNCEYKNEDGTSKIPGIKVNTKVTAVNKAKK